jgi:cytoskeleton protein RodZ
MPDARAPIAPPAIRSEGALSFTFTAPSWLEVRDASGQALVAETQPGGSDRKLKGMPPFALVVGNAQAVRLTYNGKPVDLAPHVVNTIARLKLE